MNDPNAHQDRDTQPPNRPEGPDEQRVKRYRAEQTRSPRRPPPVNLAILIGVIALIVFLIYQFFFTRPTILAGGEFNLSQAVERIEELSTVRSHLRFAVIVREESDNIVVRRLAEEDEEIDMDDISSILFQDPTLIAELHAVATFGVDLEGVADRMEVRDDSVFVTLPKSTLLDVKVVNGDTRVVARMKGLFRTPGNELMLAASQRGEAFATSFALEDTSSLQLAETRAQEILSLLIEEAGKIPVIRTEAR